MSIYSVIYFTFFISYSSSNSQRDKLQLVTSLLHCNNGLDGSPPQLIYVSPKTFILLLVLNIRI